MHLLNRLVSLKWPFMVLYLYHNVSEFLDGSNSKVYRNCEDPDQTAS